VLITLIIDGPMMRSDRVASLEEAPASEELGRMESVGEPEGGGLSGILCVRP
jgi:hypothetical protein